MHVIVGLSFAFIAAFKPSRKLSSIADFAASHRSTEVWNDRAEVAESRKKGVRVMLMV